MWTTNIIFVGQFTLIPHIFFVQQFIKVLFPDLSYLNLISDNFSIFALDTCTLCYVPVLTGNLFCYLKDTVPLIFPIKHIPKPPILCLFCLRNCFLRFVLCFTISLFVFFLV